MDGDSLPVSSRLRRHNKYALDRSGHDLPRHCHIPPTINNTNVTVGLTPKLKPTPVARKIVTTFKSKAGGLNSNGKKAKTLAASRDGISNICKNKLIEDVPDVEAIVVVKMIPMLDLTCDDGRVVESFVSKSSLR